MLNFFHGEIMEWTNHSLTVHQKYHPESAKLKTSFSRIFDVAIIIIDAVNQGNWSLSIKLRFECFVIVE